MALLEAGGAENAAEALKILGKLKSENGRAARREGVEALDRAYGPVRQI